MQGIYSLILKQLSMYVQMHVVILINIMEILMLVAAGNNCLFWNTGINQLYNAYL